MARECLFDNSPKPVFQPHEYDPKFDPKMQHFYRRKSVYDHLVKAGFVNENGEFLTRKEFDRRQALLARDEKMKAKKQQHKESDVRLEVRRMLSQMRTLRTGENSTSSNASLKSVNAQPSVRKPSSGSSHLQKKSSSTSITQIRKFDTSDEQNRPSGALSGDRKDFERKPSFSIRDSKEQLFDDGDYDTGDVQPPDMTSSESSDIPLWILNNGPNGSSGASRSFIRKRDITSSQKPLIEKRSLSSRNSISGDKIKESATKLPPLEKRHANGSRGMLKSANSLNQIKLTVLPELKSRPTNYAQKTNVVGESTQKIDDGVNNIPKSDQAFTWSASSSSHHADNPYYRIRAVPLNSIGDVAEFQAKSSLKPQSSEVESSSYHIQARS